MKSNEISDLLDNKYQNNCKYKVPNVYIFNWESDYFIQKQNEYCYEFEIKISKADFKKDFQKLEKHETLSNVNKTNKPNKFYYVAPSGIINIEDVPKYAGLIIVHENKRLETTKEAPFLHKEKIELEKKLCIKFYNYWLTERSSRIYANNLTDKYLKNIERLENELKTLKQKQ